MYDKIVNSYYTQSDRGDENGEGEEGGDDNSERRHEATYIRGQMKKGSESEKAT